MCLICENVKRVAEEDIIVYKHLNWFDEGKLGIVYRTPYKDALIEFNKVLESDLRYDYGEEGVDIGFHSFERLGNCQDDAIEESSHFIAECTIPKGAEYYKGKFGWNQPSFASNKIIYNKLILKHTTDPPNWFEEVTEIN